MNRKKSISQAYLKSLLEYNPNTGLFFWKVRRSTNCRKGWFGDKPNHHSGYYYGNIDHKTYGLHRLAFLYMEGVMPEYVDHINNNRCDNRWSNLRGVDRAGNAMNALMRKDNKSGVKGVSWKKKNSKWVVQASINGRVRHIGLFDDLELAELVAIEAREKYHGEFANHG